MSSTLRIFEHQHSLQVKTLSSTYSQHKPDSINYLLTIEYESST